jgi:hypothetical protein
MPIVLLQHLTLLSSMIVLSIALSPRRHDLGGRTPVVVPECHRRDPADRLEIGRKPLGERLERPALLAAANDG